MFTASSAGQKKLAKAATEISIFPEQQGTHVAPDPEGDAAHLPFDPENVSFEHLEKLADSNPNEFGMGQLVGGIMRPRPGGS